MGILDEVRKMQQEGRSDQEIIMSLQAQGIPMNEINNALGQNKIKQAVSESSSPNSPEDEFRHSQSYSQSDQGLQPSVMTTEQEAAPEQAQEAEPAYEQNNSYPQQNNPYQQQNNLAQASEQPPYPPEVTANYYPEQQQNEQYQSSSINSDVVSEIAEQIVIEKMSSIKNKIDALLSSKTLSDSKIEYMDERLKRIEKIVDRLQLSVLQKVGEYITNVEDIKKEIIETQKSFKSQQQKPQKNDDFIDK